MLRYTLVKSVSNMSYSFFDYQNEIFFVSNSKSLKNGRIENIDSLEPSFFKYKLMSNLQSQPCRISVNLVDFRFISLTPSTSHIVILRPLIQIRIKSTQVTLLVTLEYSLISFQWNFRLDFPLTVQ